MPKTMKIHDIEAKPGTKKCGFLKIGETPIEHLKMPLVIINGRDEGPTVCFTAGAHGCEYPGIAAVIRVLKETKPEDLSGVILGVPVINMAGFSMRAPFLNPIDEVNVGRIPRERADPAGTLSYRLMNVLINDVIMKSDLRVDLHGGDFEERLNPNTYFRKNGDPKHDETSEIISRIYGFRYLIERSARPVQPGQKVVPSITAECGGIKTMTELDIKQHTEGMRNILKFYNMIDGKPRIRVKQLLVKGFGLVKNEKGGIFYTKADIGDTVSKGQIVGEIGNIWGDIVETLRSPCEGIIRKIFTKHAANTGETLIQIMESPEPAPPFPPTDPYIDLDEYDQTSKIYI